MRKRWADTSRLVVMLVALAGAMALAVAGCLGEPGDAGGGDYGLAGVAGSSALGSQLDQVANQVSLKIEAPPVLWTPPVVPTDATALQTYLRTVLRCDDVQPLDQTAAPGGFGCLSGGTAPGDRDYLTVLPLSPKDQALQGLAANDANNAFRAAYDGFYLARYLVGKGKVDGYPVGTGNVGCHIVASAGPWSFDYAETHRLADEPTEMSRLVQSLDAVVHEDCAKTALAPDTLALEKAMGGGATCEVERVGHAPLHGGSPVVVTWADYDVAFTCSNGYTLFHIPPGTADSFARHDAAQVGCRPYVVVAGRWLVHQPATTALPPGHDRSVLRTLATTFGTRVEEPCGG